MNETFEKLNNEFNVPSTPKDPVEEIALVKLQTKELVEKSANIKTLEDKEYLQQETKELIDNSKRVLHIVQNDIKIGTPAKTVEVYAKLLTSTVEALRELRELNKMVADMQMFTEPQETKTSINIKMTGKDLIAMMKEAKESSQMKAVETNFTIEGDEPNAK